MDQVPKSNSRNAPSTDEHMRPGLWIALVASCTVLASVAFACAAPLAAVATFAGTRMRVRAGCVVVGVAWLANQLIGYLLLGYPRTWDSLGWGAAIGIATALGFVGTVAVFRAGLRDPVMTAMGLAVSFIVYEATLLAATECPSFLGPSVFSRGYGADLRGQCCRVDRIARTASVRAGIEAFEAAPTVKPARRLTTC